MPPRRGFVPRPSDGRGCRRQVRDLVFGLWFYNDAAPTALGKSQRDLIIQPGVAKLRRVIVKIKIKTPTGFHQMDGKMIQLF